MPKIILNGTTACKGVVQGKVKIVNTLKDLEKVEEGDVLVANQTTPDFVLAMFKAAAIVTDEGGVLSHAAIVSREIGKPCIVGTLKATKILKNEEIVVVDADNGIVVKC